MNKNWTQWHNNPFRAIQACVAESQKPDDWDKVKKVLSESMAIWVGSPASYLRDVLETVYKETNISVEIEESSTATRYRAAYED